MKKSTYVEEFMETAILVDYLIQNEKLTEHQEVLAQAALSDLHTLSLSLTEPDPIEAAHKMIQDGKL